MTKAVFAMSSRWKKIIKPYFIVRESKDIEMTPTIHIAMNTSSMGVPNSYKSLNQHNETIKQSGIMWKFRENNVEMLKNSNCYLLFTN